MKSTAVPAEMLRINRSGTDRANGRGKIQRTGRRAMNGSLKRWLLWSVLVLPFFAPTGVSAQQAQPQYYTKPSGGVSLEQAADMVRRHTGGRVLSATPVNKGGERGYNVRVLVDGKRVKQYYVDSEGRLSSR
jgi:hypothetical protein